MIRKRIGELLVESGLITEQQLEQALMLQKSKNKRLGKIIVELGYVSERQIAEAIAKQLSLPLVDCKDSTITDELKALVPREIAEKRIVMPLELKNRTLTLAMANPLDWETMDDISFRTGLKVSPVVSPEISLLTAIEKNYGTDEEIWNLLKNLPSYEGIEITKEIPQKDIDLGSLSKSSSVAPIIKLVTMVIVDAVKSRVSDIHIEPREKYVQARYRIDGDLKDIFKFPKKIQDSIISRIKIIANLDITNRRLPQDGSSYLKLGGKIVDLRISTLPSIYGEKVVIRLLDRSAGIIPPSKLGMSETVLNSLIDTFNQPQGMLIITGPTGSGKTTTLYAILKNLQSETDNIITIEDPVEYKLEGITQVSVNEAIGLTFSSVLRSILRQDPDIIMLGEIRDRETAEIAVKASLTGHFVLSTLHTNDTVSTVTRLVDLGLPNFLVSSALSGVFAQRLVRRICENCKTETKPPSHLNFQGLPPLKHFYQSKGCPKCYYTGYYGQAGVYEFLKITPKLRRLIARNASENELWDAAREEGTITLFGDAWAKVNKGITSMEEVLSKIPMQYFEEPDRLRITREEVTQKINGKKVVAVDLIKDMELIQQTLEPEGYEVVNTSSKDTLEVITKEPPNLILLDSSSGAWDFLKKLREDIKRVYIAAIVIAELFDKGKETKWRDLGIIDFMYRPINPQRLLSTVNNIMKELA